LFGTPRLRWATLRAWLWGVWFPLACLVLGVVLGPWGWASWLIYPLLFLRRTLCNPGPLNRRAFLALFQLLSRFPESWGLIQFRYERFLLRQARLIEYK